MQASRSASRGQLACLLGVLASASCQREAAPQDSGVVDLRFVGDILLDSAPGREIKNGADPFVHVAALLEAAAVAIGNLECPVATTGERLEKPFTFRAAPQTLGVLKRHLDVVSLANNHSGDYGPEALVETLQHLEAAGLPHFGAGRNLQSAHQAHVFERNGVRIALLGYDEFKPRSFEAGSDHPGVAWGDDEQVVHDILREREAGAHVVIPFFHWGWENEDQPSERQRQFARQLIDVGASAVVGCHPHVTQGAEIYQDRPIIYSLGNFVFDLLDIPRNAVGWGLQLVVDQQGVARWGTVPVRIDALGFPEPDPTEASPCAKRGDAEARLCVGLEPDR